MQKNDVDPRLVRLSEIDEVDSLSHIKCISVTTADGSFTTSQGVMLHGKSYISTNEEVPTYEPDTGQFNMLRADELSAGDFVLTHKNRWQEITQVHNSVLMGRRVQMKNGMCFTTTVGSKISVYDPDDKVFGIGEVGRQLQIIINMLTACSLAEFSIDTVEHEKYDYMLSIERVGDMNASKEHSFLVFNTDTLEYRLVKTMDLDDKIHLMGVRFE